MKLNIQQMDHDKAREISIWTYKDPYSMYNMDGSDECIKEFLSGYYFSVSNKEKKLIGYYCFGKFAQVPIGNQFGAYDSKEFTDVGLGIKPSLCGKGMGMDFFRKGLEFARNELSIEKFRLTVADFNERAIKVYEKLGFKKVDYFERVSDLGKIKFWIMILY